MYITGYIKGYDGMNLSIVAPFDNVGFLADKAVSTCEIRLEDGRSITTEQRRHIYATLRDIAEWSGYEPEELKALMKYDYIAHTGAAYFSLSDCTMTAAREFLEYLIEFCIERDVLTGESLSRRAPHIERYVYACLYHRKCAVCGALRSDVHHVDEVGIGADRRKISHLGRRAESLCRKHHCECHSIGQTAFDEWYHLIPIRLDERLCRRLGLRYK